MLCTSHNSLNNDPTGQGIRMRFVVCLSAAKESGVQRRTEVGVGELGPHPVMCAGSCLVGTGCKQTLLLSRLHCPPSLTGWTACLRGLLCLAV